MHEMDHWKDGEVTHVTTLSSVVRPKQPPMYRVEHRSFTVDRTEPGARPVLVGQSQAIYADLDEARKEHVWLRDHPPMGRIISLSERSDP